MSEAVVRRVQTLTEQAELAEQALSLSLIKQTGAMVYQQILQEVR